MIMSFLYRCESEYVLKFVIWVKSVLIPYEKCMPMINTYFTAPSIFNDVNISTIAVFYMTLHKGETQQFTTIHFHHTDIENTNNLKSINSSKKGNNEFYKLNICFRLIYPYFKEFTL